MYLFNVNFYLKYYFSAFLVFEYSRGGRRMHLLGEMKYNAMADSGWNYPVWIRVGSMVGVVPVQGAGSVAAAVKGDEGVGAVGSGLSRMAGALRPSRLLAALPPARCSAEAPRARRWRERYRSTFTIRKEDTRDWSRMVHWDPPDLTRFTDNRQIELVAEKFKCFFCCSELLQIANWTFYG